MEAKVLRIQFQRIARGIIPVGREKLLNPLGHSGQRKLQLVVGSMEILYGNALTSARFDFFERRNEVYSFIAFHKRYGVMVRSISIKLLRFREKGNADLGTRI